jgi:hypothetical protein
VVEVTTEGTEAHGGKQKLEAKEKELAEEHLKKYRERWYRNAQGAVLPQFRSTKKGKKMAGKAGSGVVNRGGVENDTEQAEGRTAVRKGGGGQGRGHSGTAALRRYIHYA